MKKKRKRGVQMHAHAPSTEKERNTSVRKKKKRYDTHNIQLSRKKKVFKGGVGWKEVKRMCNRMTAERERGF